MYAFRKPFAVGTFEDLTFLSIDYKIWLITAQTIGYTFSKFLGIKFVSELKKNQRAIGIVILLACAQVSLILFAIIPAPWNISMLFLNGLPLGMVWGIVFSYVEGRRNTEFLGAGLCISFIFSSGFVKTVGKFILLHWDVSEFAMPYITGFIFSLPALLCIWLLQQSPLPDSKDIAERVERKAMTFEQRLSIFKRFAPGLILLILGYTLLTAFRDFRDNFSAEIWQALNYGESSKIFTTTEIPVSLFILVVMGSLMLIRSNQKAFIVGHIIILLGFLITGLATLAFEKEAISAPYWMIFMGSGLYLGYVPFNTIMFDRMIATFRLVGNVGFLIYLADSFGYLGSLGVLFFKNFSQPDISWLSFFISSTYLVSVVGIILVILSLAYFSVKMQTVKNNSMVLNAKLGNASSRI
ncbi:MAG: DUF5690 family protein, partial [Cyclobacteriaceae bacterium]